MDPLDIVVATLLKTASAEIVKQGISKISEKLSAAFRKGDHNEIKKVIELEGLTAPAAALASKGLENSKFVYFQSPKDARPEHKLKTFSEILNYGFQLSLNSKMDIVVAGSLLSDKHISVFATEKGPPVTYADPLKIYYKQSNGHYAIIPVKEAEEFRAKYFKKVRRIRDESDAYVAVDRFDDDSSWGFAVSRITAGSICFQYQALIATKYKSELGEEEESRFYMTNWAAGLQKMIDGFGKVPSLSRLTEEEAKDLVSVMDALKERVEQDPED